MVSIKQDRIVSLKMDIEFKVRPHNFLVNGGVMLNPIKPPNQDNGILLAVYYTVEPDVIIDDVKFDVELVMPYFLEPRNEITSQDLFECVEMTRKYLQSIFDATFSDKNKLVVPPITFEALEKKLFQHLEYIKQK